MSNPTRLFLVFVYSVLAFPLCARVVTGFDLITMKNGDYHHGTVAVDMFEFQTDYGDLLIPYHLMKDIYLASQNEMDLLLTGQGDRFSGQLKLRELTLLRSQQPVLQLDVEDIAQINFTPRSIRKIKIPSPDAIELTNGDRFHARIQLNDFLLKSATGIHSVSVNDLHFIDFVSLNDGEMIREQVTMNDGTIKQGEILAVDKIVAMTRYGQQLLIPVHQVESLAYHVNYSNGTDNFNYRRRVSSANLLRDRMVDGTLAPEMVVLRGGAFKRGDHQGDGDNDEKPLIPMKLSAFAISIYEVSFAEFDRFCEDTRHPKPDDSGWGRGRRPVVNVSWNDAVAYTEWLSRKTRQIYRLPSDAEWEYAARGGSEARFWWGNELKPIYANCSGCGSLWDGEKTAPVGKLPANSFGLHDTAGNVFEWVADCFHTDFSGAPADGEPLDKTGCGKRVIRGGAWSFPPHEIRSANRWRDFPTRQSDDTGFRVVRELRVE